jgi:hypothetical protein
VSGTAGVSCPTGRCSATPRRPARRRGPHPPR